MQDRVEETLANLDHPSTETKVRRKGRSVSVKFGKGEEDQKRAHDFVSALRDAHLEAEEKKGEPLYVEKDGTAIYRILLFGLRWYRMEKGSSCYRAPDGPMRFSGLDDVSIGTCAREWAVGKDADGKWGVVLHDEREGSPHIIASGLRTCREAKTAAEEAARRMPELE